MPVVEEIRKRYGALSAVERRIADVILEDPEQVTGMTVAHLAARARVSEGSVINFSTLLGLRGFSALKISLAREADAFPGFSFGSVTAEDTPMQALQKVIGSAVDAFSRAGRCVDGEALAAAAGALSRARRIELYGAGDSALMAQDAYFHMMRMGLPACAVTDYLSVSISADQLDESCAALAISHSGQTIQIVDAMAAAKRRGAVTICVTSYGDSDLAALCDVALVTPSAETDQHREAQLSRLAHLLVLDSLCAYISAQRGPETVERLDRVAAELSRCRYQKGRGR